MMKADVSARTAQFAAALLGETQVPGGLAFPMQVPAKQLDYSLESLGALQQYLERVRPHASSFDTEVYQNTLLAAGSYLGEVIRRQVLTEAAWSQPESGGMPVLELSGESITPVAQVQLVLSDTTNEDLRTFAGNLFSFTADSASSVQATEASTEETDDFEFDFIDELEPDSPADLLAEPAAFDAGEAATPAAEDDFGFEFDSEEESPALDFDSPAPTAKEPADEAFSFDDDFSTESTSESAEKAETATPADDLEDLFEEGTAIPEAPTEEFDFGTEASADGFDFADLSGDSGESVEDEIIEDVEILEDDAFLEDDEPAPEVKAEPVKEVSAEEDLFGFDSAGAEEQEMPLVESSSQDLADLGEPEEVGFDFDEWDDQPAEETTDTEPRAAESPADALETSEQSIEEELFANTESEEPDLLDFDNELSAEEPLVDEVDLSAEPAAADEVDDFFGSDAPEPGPEQEPALESDSELAEPAAAQVEESWDPLADFSEPDVTPDLIEPETMAAEAAESETPDASAEPVAESTSAGPPPLAKGPNKPEAEWGFEDFFAEDAPVETNQDAISAAGRFAEADPFAEAEAFDPESDLLGESSEDSTEIEEGSADFAALMGMPEDEESSEPITDSQDAADETAEVADQQADQPEEVDELFANETEPDSKTEAEAWDPFGAEDSEAPEVDLTAETVSADSFFTEEAAEEATPEAETVSGDFFSELSESEADENDSSPAEEVSTESSAIPFEDNESEELGTEEAAEDEGELFADFEADAEPAEAEVEAFDFLSGGDDSSDETAEVDFAELDADEPVADLEELEEQSPAAELPAVEDDFFASETAEADAEPEAATEPGEAVADTEDDPFGFLGTDSEESQPEESEAASAEAEPDEAETTAEFSFDEPEAASETAPAADQESEFDFAEEETEESAEPAAEAEEFSFDELDAEPASPVEDLIAADSSEEAGEEPLPVETAEETDESDAFAFVDADAEDLSLDELPSEEPESAESVVDEAKAEIEEAQLEEQPAEGPQTEESLADELLAVEEETAEAETAMVEEVETVEEDSLPMDALPLDEEESVPSSTGALDSLLASLSGDEEGESETDESALAAKASFEEEASAEPAEQPPALQKQQAEIEKHLAAAAKGDASAQLELGILYESGLFAEDELPEAVRRYQEAADQGNVTAMGRLGQLYYLGRGVSQNWKKGVQLFLKAAKSGEPLAQSLLGMCLEHGKGAPRDMEKALRCYYAGANAGSAACQVNLACCYLRGRGIKQQPRVAVRWLVKAAEQENGHALLMLGACYEGGVGVKADPTQAEEYYRRAVATGFSLPDEKLSIHTEHGDPQAADAVDPFWWLRQAADAGETWAQHNLGLSYLAGHGVRESASKTLHWFQQAAKAGFAPSQYELGRCFETALGTPKDMARAAKWYARAAESGHAPAQSRLALLYECGFGVKQDSKAAKKWRSQAEKQLAELGTGR